MGGSLSPKAFGTSGGNSTRLDASSGYYRCFDFDDTTTGSYAVTATGVNTLSPSTILASTPGLVQHSVTAAGDRASWSIDGGGVREFLFGGGAWTFRARGMITTLSDGVNNILYQVGYGDVLAPGDQVDAALFENDRNTNGSNNWFFLTSSNSVRTRTDLGVTPTAGAYDSLRFDVAADGSSIVVQVNKVTKATITTNIPTGAARQFGELSRAVKQLGAGNLLASTDYVESSASIVR